jgi:hypothetical protein
MGSFASIFNFRELVKRNSNSGRGRETVVSRGGSIETEGFQGANPICDEFAISYSPQNT